MNINNLFGSQKLKAMLVAADAQANTALTAAKITTLRVDGKDVSALEAPLSDKIAAIAKLVGTGSATEPTAELIAENGTLAEKAEELSTELTAAKATIAAQQQKLLTLEGQLNVANASVQALTATNATNESLLKGSNAEVARLTALAAANKQVLAERCLAANCLDLRGADGKLLAADAAESDRMAAALKLSHEDLFKAYCGAVNAAVKQTGVTFAAIPNPTPSGNGPASKPQAKGRERFRAAVKFAH